MCKKITEAIEKCQTDNTESDDSFMGRLKCAWEHIKQCELGEAALFVWYAFSICWQAYRVVAAGWDLCQLFLYGAEQIVKDSSVVKCIKDIIGSTAFKVLDCAFLAIGLVLDIYTLVSTMENGLKSEAALKIEKHVDTLKTEQRFWDELLLNAKKNRLRYSKNVITYDIAIGCIYIIRYGVITLPIY